MSILKLGACCSTSRKPSGRYERLRKDEGGIVGEEDQNGWKKCGDTHRNRVEGFPDNGCTELLKRKKLSLSMASSDDEGQWAKGRRKAHCDAADKNGKGRWL